MAFAPPTPLQAAAETSPQTLQFRALQAAAAASPRTARLRTLRALADGRPHPVAQRVRFSATGDFAGEHLKPGDLPERLGKAVAATYAGETKADVRPINTPAEDRAWLAERGGVADAPTTILADVLATDWEGLGPQRPASEEVGQMSQTFFDQQTSLMGDLNDAYGASVVNNPSRPIRVASFKFGRGSDGALTTALIDKPIEDAVQTQITAGNLINKPGTEAVRAKVRANVNQTLFNAGQFQWIAANWGAISDTHDVYIDVDYYPNRTPAQAGLHKDSIGETLFVNLTYNNREGGEAPETLVDKTGYKPFEQGMPQVAQDLVAGARRDNQDAPEQVKGGLLPARGRVSFMDPAIWHSTPLFGRRPPQLNLENAGLFTREQVMVEVGRRGADTQRGVADRLLGKLEDAESFSAEECQDLFAVRVDGPRTCRQLRGIAARRQEPGKGQLLARIAEYMRTVTYTGKAINGIFEPFVAGVRLDSQKTKHIQPFEARGRLVRTRSQDLLQRPQEIDSLNAQAEQARSFIRTWIILRKKDT